eukprot:TRINITY_DN26790_c0_g1_i1.p1 TRINITY_DN26790_c0_g1~~TRINITY_DN26790_c0_g1_i1.p1  ORF type:complete len:482 (-),score=111.44 TRINITY_DN26790_c0_g1_i1:39-1484(-)
MVSCLRRRLSCYISARFFHACVVGSGPSGCYTAEKLLKRFKDVNVDVIERLPTPFGLVRYGVAPDHPETKVVTNQFSRIFENERCSFFGNVSLGKDVHLSELRKLYHVVVLAYGAEDDKVLGIPAESLTGIHSAREFVWWYNGHPDYSSLAVDLQSTDTAVVLGMGNVALDVARVLLRPLEELCSTDIAEHAWSALQRSCIRRVYLVGRRGPVQAACTAKELREILGLKGLSLEIQDEDLVTSSLDEEEMERSRSKKRVYELFCKASKEHASSKSFSEKKLHFVFFRKPERFLSSICESKVAGIRLEKTVLKGDDSSGHQSAIGTGEFEEIECGLVLKSIGYKARLDDEFPFDVDTGTVPNFKGRVMKNPKSDNPLYEKGLYVVGWLKRGATGIIGTNLFCAEETVQSILEDVNSGLIDTSNSSCLGTVGLTEALKKEGTPYVSFEDWKKIDTQEKQLGLLKGKAREKLTSWPDLLKVASE